VYSYSTAQVARMLKIGRQTLHRWMKDQPDLAPPKRHIGGVIVRIWTERYVQKVSKYKKNNYRKGRGRKPKLKPKLIL
jgi:predicted DNA-binding transcriptional regulator AlpA